MTTQSLLPTITLKNQQIIKIDKGIGSEADPFGGDYVDLVVESNNLTNMVKNGSTEINVIINSNGGRVSAGQVFIESMKAAQSKGIVVNCIVDGNAFSMAASIFTECTNRYATFGSKIMWHSVGRMITFTKLNEQVTRKLLIDMQNMNNILWKSTKPYFSKEYFEEHFDKETQLRVTLIELESPEYVKVIGGYTFENELKE